MPQRSNETYLESLYSDLLGRKADDGGKKYWLDQLAIGKATQESVRNSFLRSKEHNKPYVDNLYTELLGRKADEGGMGYWLNSLETGAETREAVRNNFLLSPEYNSRMRIGTTPQSPQSAPAPAPAPAALAQFSAGGVGADIDTNAAGFRRKKSSARMAGLTSKGTGQFKIAGQSARSSGLNIGT